MSTFIASACCGYGAVSVSSTGSSGGGSTVATTPRPDEFLVGAEGSPMASDTSSFTWLPIIGKNVKILLDGVLTADKNSNPGITDRQWVKPNNATGEIEFKDQLFEGQRVTIMY